MKLRQHPHQEQCGVSGSPIYSGSTDDGRLVRAVQSTGGEEPWASPDRALLFHRFLLQLPIGLDIILEVNVPSKGFSFR